MVDVRPDPKPAKRKPARTFRKRATRTEWRAIHEAKRGPCRVCGHETFSVTLHHLVNRSQGGDDVAENIVPLCGGGTRGCHGLVTTRDSGALRELLSSLTVDERGYLATKLGVDWARRAFGV